MSRICALALLLVTGCGGGAAATQGPPATDARVGLMEWEVTSSAGALAAGPVTLEVTNAGTTAHDLRVAGDRAETAVATIVPGERATRGAGSHRRVRDRPVVQPAWPPRPRHGAPPPGRR